MMPQIILQIIFFIAIFLEVIFPILIVIIKRKENRPKQIKLWRNIFMISILFGFVLGIYTGIYYSLKIELLEKEFCEDRNGYYQFNGLKLSNCIIDNQKYVFNDTFFTDKSKIKLKKEE